MSENNGQFGGKKVFEILLDSGEIVYVQPLSIYLIRALRQKAEELFPFPDKTRYERALDDDKALEPGQMIPAEDNPDYRAAYDSADKKQQAYVNDQCVLLSVEPVQDKQTIIAKYQTRLDQLRDILTLPDDAWDATLRFCLMTSQQDFNKVTEAIMGRALPREEDILDGMRIFRCYLRENTAVRSDRKEKPQGTDEDHALEPQPDSGTVQPGASVGVANAQSDASARG
jgi:hypothetical protein